MTTTLHPSIYTIAELVTASVAASILHMGALDVRDLVVSLHAEGKISDAAVEAAQASADAQREADKVAEGAVWAAVDETVATTSLTREEIVRAVRPLLSETITEHDALTLRIELADAL